MKHILLLTLTILNGSTAVGAGYVQRAWNYAKSFFVAEPEQSIEAPAPQQGKQPFELTKDLWLDKYRLLEEYKTIEPNVPQDQEGKTAYLQRAETWVQKTYPQTYASLAQEKTTQMMQAHYGKKIQVPSNLMLFYYEDLEKPPRTVPITLESNIKKNLQIFTENVQAINTIQEFKDSVKNLMSSLDAAQKLLDTWVPDNLNKKPWKEYQNTVSVFRKTLTTSLGYLSDEPYREVDEFKSIRNSFYQNAQSYLESETNFSLYWAELRSLLRKLYYHALFINTYNNGITEFSQALELLKSIVHEHINDLADVKEKSKQLEKSLAEALNIFNKTKKISTTKEGKQRIIAHEYDKDIETIIDTITYFKEVMPLIDENKNSNKYLQIIFDSIKKKQYKVNDQTTLKLFNEYKDHLCNFIQQIQKLNEKISIKEQSKAPTKTTPQAKPKTQKSTTPEEEEKERKYKAIREKAAQLKKDPTWQEKTARMIQEAEEYRKRGEQIPTIVAPQPHRMKEREPAKPTAKFVGEKNIQFKTLDDWENARKKLPTYRSNPPETDASNAPVTYPSTILTRQEFLRIVEEYLKVRKKHLAENKWVGSLDNALFDLDDINFRPFSEKLTLPNASTAILLGDLHGDFHSFMTYILQLKNMGLINNDLSLKKNVYLIFLGDYVDRGLYGAEVMALMMSLYIKNPEQVIPVRGNHEDRFVTANYGFHEELKQKFAADETLYNKIYKVHDLLPVVLLLGSGNNTSGYWYAECAHGSFELGHDLRSLLNNPVNKLPQILYTPIKELDRNHAITTLYETWKNKSPGLATSLANLSKSRYADYPLEKIIFEYKSKDFNEKTHPINIKFGYMWGDYYFSQPQNSFYGYKKGRGAEWGKEITRSKFALDSLGSKNKIVGMFRAHQHNTSSVNLLRRHGGLYQHFSSNQWNLQKNNPIVLENGFVITFNLSPDSIYGTNNTSFVNMTMGILTINEDFNKTTLQPVEIPVPK